MEDDKNIAVDKKCPEVLVKTTMEINSAWSQTFFQVIRIRKQRQSEVHQKFRLWIPQCWPLQLPSWVWADAENVG